jgi:hypothetical protein
MELGYSHEFGRRENGVEAVYTESGLRMDEHQGQRAPRTASAEDSKRRGQRVPRYEGTEGILMVDSTKVQRN